MSTEKIILTGEYLETRVLLVSNTVMPRGGELEKAYKKWKLVEVIVGNTRKFAAELFPDVEISRCSDEERQKLMQAIKDSGLEILENPEIIK